MKRSKIQIAVALMVLTGLACEWGDRSSTSPEVLVQATFVNTPEPSVHIYQAGDVVESGSVTIVLDSAFVLKGQLIVHFTIQNHAAETLDLGSLPLFSATTEDGRLLEEDTTNCVLDTLTLPLSPGQAVRGNICWKDATVRTYRIYYEGSLFSSGDTVIWEADS